MHVPAIKHAVEKKQLEELNRNNEMQLLTSELEECRSEKQILELRLAFKETEMKLKDCQISSLQYKLGSLQFELALNKTLNEIQINHKDRMLVEKDLQLAKKEYGYMYH